MDEDPEDTNSYQCRNTLLFLSPKEYGRLMETCVVNYHLPETLLNNV